jgi:hypothetical protein
LDYLEELLKDFIERAKTDPAALFNQICSLAVGPLVTRATGSNLSEFPTIQKQTLHFVPITASA